MNILLLLFYLFYVYNFFIVLLLLLCHVCYCDACKCLHGLGICVLFYPNKLMMIMFQLVERHASETTTFDNVKHVRTLKNHKCRLQYGKFHKRLLKYARKVARNLRN